VHLTAALKREYRLADNRLTLEGEWDEAMLAAEMDWIREGGGDLAFTGFTDAELRDIELEASGGEEDPVPPPPAIPVSRPGDLWHLGEHRVLCGDATVPGHYSRVLEDRLAQCVWTDPPYNVGIGILDLKQAKQRTRRVDGLEIKNDRMREVEFEGMIDAAFGQMFESMRPGAPIYVAHPDTGGQLFRAAFCRAGFYLSSCLVWNKNTFVMGRSDYHWQHEPILYGWKPGAAHTWVGGRDKATVFNCDRPSTSPEHPTMKPVALVVEMLRNSAPRGALVLDPFAGAGSTLMACDALGASARLIELDPRFVDVIVRRWQEATNQVSTLAGGPSFAVVAERRGIE
jgi:DNA modification methylase